MTGVATAGSRVPLAAALSWLPFQVHHLARHTFLPAAFRVLLSWSHQLDTIPCQQYRYVRLQQVQAHVTILCLYKQITIICYR